MIDGPSGRSSAAAAFVMAVTVAMLVMPIALVAADTTFVCYLKPTGSLTNASLTTLRTNFTTDVAACVNSVTSRVSITSMDIWGVDSLTNHTVYAVTFNFLTDALIESQGGSTSLQLAVAFNVVLKAGSANALYVQYMDKYGVFNFYVPGLTTTPPPPTTTVAPVPSTPRPTNETTNQTNTTAAPGPTFTAAPTVTAPNATIAAIGEESSDNNVIIGVVFGIIGACVVVGLGIFVLKRFILTKKKAKSSGGGYARKHTV